MRSGSVIGRHLSVIGLGKQDAASDAAAASGSHASSPGNAHWGASVAKAAGMAFAKDAAECKANTAAFAVPGGGDISVEVRSSASSQSIERPAQQQCDSLLFLWLFSGVSSPLPPLWRC